MIKVLKNDESQVRVNAAEALGKLNDTRAVEPLVEALKDKARPLRVSAVEALGELNDTSSVEPLINGLNGVYADPYAALDLALLNDPKGIEAVIRACYRIERSEDALRVIGPHSGICYGSGCR